ncbi:class I SAM-dependent methyltransferase [Halosolutus amylolyticus]|uniref:Class I SAM-dependent methyltransferase n=1 Tax=Halosolutus amylolyticus TaxID=2932267 RepID=A0ABD5PRZ0_9EURY|nr:class I SAM-dependent methyltransferase [Halosolutus amylolyticus]
MTQDADDVRRRWADRSRAYSPAYYAYYGPDERSERLRALLDDRVDRTAAVLELGCSSGRHLAHLADHGYANLAGIDVNDDAFDVMERTYPDLAATGTFHHGSIESVVPSFDDDQFDVVYSVETLQHLHPSCDWLVDDLERVTAELLVTAEIEPADPDDDRTRPADEIHETTVDGLALYKRRWDHVLSGSGFVETRSIDLDRVTFRAFRPTDR